MGMWFINLNLTYQIYDCYTGTIFDTDIHVLITFDGDTLDRFEVEAI